MGRQSEQVAEGSLTEQPPLVRPHVTFHLAPEQVWSSRADDAEYRSDSLLTEGFIHCTDGEDLVIEVANRYYRDDPEPYLLLDVDVTRVKARVVYDDAARQYPHIYGPIDRDAVIRVRRMERGADGAFLTIGEEPGASIP